MIHTQCCQLYLQNVKFKSWTFTMNSTQHFIAIICNKVSPMDCRIIKKVGITEYCFFLTRMCYVKRRQLFSTSFASKEE